MIRICPLIDRGAPIGVGAHRMRMVGRPKSRQVVCGVGD
jgi:hypothetical protein